MESPKGPKFRLHHLMVMPLGGRFMPIARKPLSAQGARRLNLRARAPELQSRPGDISADGLGMTGRECDAASPREWPACQPRIPQICLATRTQGALTIEHGPSFKLRRYPTHSAQDDLHPPGWWRGKSGTAEPVAIRHGITLLGRPLARQRPVFGRDVHAGGPTGPGRTEC